MTKLKTKDMSGIDTTDKVKSLLIVAMNKFYKHSSTEEKIDIIQDIISYPEKYKNHKVFSKICKEFITAVKVKATNYKLSEPKKFSIYGKGIISEDTIQQMTTVMSLPPAVYGTLMPDAHTGYGMPIGAAVATKDAVMPYGVGSDISCMMKLSLYREDDQFFKKYPHAVKVAVINNTHFGITTESKLPVLDSEVLENMLFSEIDILRKLRGKARRQIGTSGSSNHFVDVGYTVLEEGNKLGLDAGNYLSILSHSGSRGLGAGVCDYYTDIAKSRCNLPKGAKNLVWLDTASHEGIEYWKCMTLCGDYAEESHNIIHQRIAKDLGIKEILSISNKHNFAWKETINGEELIVHRKGCTPAGEGVYGIIPHNMRDGGFIVTGLGNPDSLMSSSHGCGRSKSRSEARNEITGSMLRKETENNITLIGGTVEESPSAYKDADAVMESQKDCIEVIGKFVPKVVRMCDEGKI